MIMLRIRAILIVITIAFVNSASGFSAIKFGQVLEGELNSQASKFVLEEVHSTSSLDLNNDGVQEQIVSFLCGNAGCENYIFQSVSADKHIFLGKIFFHLKSFETIRNDQSDFSDFLVYVRVSTQEGCLFRYVFNQETGYSYDDRKACGDANLVKIIRPQLDK